MKKSLSIIVFCLLLGGVASQLWALSPAAFLKKSPIPPGSLQIEPSSLQTLIINEEGLGTIELTGTRNTALEVFWGDYLVSFGEDRKVVIPFPVSSQPELHEIKIVDLDGSKRSYFFELRMSRSLPSSLKGQIRIDSGEVIDRFNFVAGTYSADEWVELKWYSEHGVLDHDEFEVRRFERTKKKIRTAIEEEQQELERLLLERNLLAQQLDPVNAGGNQIHEKNRKRRVSSLSELKEASGVSSFQVSQGIGLLSLQQPQQARVETTQWLLQAEYQRVSSALWTTGLAIQGFILPLKSSGTVGSPRYVKAGLDFGAQFSVGSQISLNPKLGFDYQSLITSSPVGYRNLMGPRLEVSSEMKTGSQSLLKAALLLNLFAPNLQGGLFTNYQWGVRAVYQWEATLFTFNTFFAGVEGSQMRLNFESSDLSSSILQTFVGVRF